MINFNGCDRREFHIVQPERALDQGIAWNPHYLDRDQSRFAVPSRSQPAVPAGDSDWFRRKRNCSSLVPNLD